MQQNSGVSSNLNSVRFINSQTGWCVGDSGNILKTVNGGSNWIQSFIGSRNLGAIYFTSISTGYITGDSGLILKTTNAGLNWLDISVNSYAYLTTISFINNTIGYVGGHRNYVLDISYIYKTTNGGLTWDSLYAIGFNYKCIQFVNDMTGWVSSTTINSEINKTTNGGINWNNNYTVTTADKIKSMFFVDALTGFAGSVEALGPSLIKTTNGGNNWTYAGTGIDSYSIYFPNQNNGWSCGQNGQIWCTTNLGLSWLQQTTRINGLIYRSIYFTDSLTGWCVGDSGRILKTTTGGILTNFTNTNSEIPTEYKLNQNYPNPFNPKTIINFELGITNYVSLKVYDVLGNEVATLVNEKRSAGSYSAQFDGSNIPSGIYFYRLEVDGNMIDTKRMVLLK